MRGQGAAPGARAAFDVMDYAITLDLPDRGDRIEARAVLTVLRRSSADTLVLDLIGLRVDSVLVDARPVAFARDERTIRIPLPPFPGRPDTLAVAVRYGGAPSDGLIIRTDHAGRWTAFGDNWPDRARYWIPSVDEPRDKATVSWTVRAPADRRVVANGELEAEIPLPRSNGPERAERAEGAEGAERAQGAVGAGGGGGARTLTRWRESRPVPTYVMVIAAAPLAYIDLGRSACGLSEFGGCVRQSVYVEPEVVARLPGPFARAGEIVDFFATLVAPFPYERLAHVQSLTRFGGMENATAIFYAGESVRNGSLSERTVAHETAHQWFGDAVTEERFADLWLSEGFATYWAALWVQHAYGDSAFRAAMAAERLEIVRSPVTAERPIRDTLETEYLKLLNTNSYQKGAWVLHMLRGLLGDSAFFRGVRSYYVAHRHGTARTEDLRAALERASGVSLGWFFDQWVMRPGIPELVTQWRYDRASRRVTLYITQGARFAPYRFPLTVAVRDVRGRVRRITIQVEAERSQRITLPLQLDASPRDLVFDPDVELLATFAPP